MVQPADLPAALRVAIAGELTNATNYPKNVAPQVLGTSMTDLIDTVTEAALAATGYLPPHPDAAETPDAEEQHVEVDGLVTGADDDRANLRRVLIGVEHDWPGNLERRVDAILSWAQARDPWQYGFLKPGITGADVWLLGTADDYRRERASVESAKTKPRRVWVRRRNPVPGSWESVPEE